MTEPANPAPSDKNPDARPPLIAVLTPVPTRKAVRPPAPGAASLIPRPSAAPPPRMRSTAVDPAHHPQAASNVGPGIAHPLDLAEAPSAAALEIASLLSQQASNVQPASPPERSVPTPFIPRVRAGQHDPLFVRRTLIPILLSLALILGGAGIYLIVSGSNSALADFFPARSAITLIVLGAIALAVGIANMLSVKYTLRHGA